MDQNNQPTPNSPAENTDLNKQYQDILDRYSKDLAETPASPPPAPPIETQPPVTELTETPAPLNPPIEVPVAPVAFSESHVTDIAAPSPEYTPPVTASDIADTFIATPPPTPTPTETFVPPILPESPLVSASAPPSGGGFFKVLFFIALIIFLGVFGTIAYSVFYKGQLPQLGSAPTPTVSENIPSPTPVDTYCNVNDKIVKKGDSFPAADGCNTCTCSPDLTIACTVLACSATPSSALLPTAKVTAKPTTKPSSSSATKVSPTVAPTLAPTDYNY